MHRNILNKKGIFALTKTAELLLVLLAIIVLVFFIYFLRERIGFFAEKILDILK